MIVALIALAFAAGDPAAHPPLDTPYRLTREEVREVAGRPCHFTADNRIMFTLDAGGLVAVVTLERLDTDAPAPVARRFLAASGALKGRALRFHLDQHRRITSLDDQATLWAATLAAYRAITPPAPPGVQRSPASRDPAGALAALPAQAQLQMLGSALDGLLIDPTDALPSDGMRDVVLPATTSGTGAADLHGRERVETMPDGRRRTTLDAQADGIQLTRIRVLDPAAGWAVSEQEDVRRTIGERVQATQSRTTLAPMVS